MKKEELTHAIQSWMVSQQTKEDFYPLMHAVAKAFRQGVGLDGTSIDEAINDAYDSPVYTDEQIESMREILINRGAGGSFGNDSPTYWEAEVVIEEYHKLSL